MRFCSLETDRSADGATDSAPGTGGLQPGEDGGIVGGPRTPQQIAAQKRLQQTQAQVDEVSPDNFLSHTFCLREVGCHIAQLMSCVLLL
jgi:hypothetical protein